MIRPSLAAAVLLLASCGDGGVRIGSGGALLANRSGDGVTRGGPFSALQAAVQGRTGDTRRLGTDEFLAPSGPPRPIVERDGAGEITLNLVDVPLAQAVQAVLGEALGRNYTIAPGLGGTVTLQTTQPLGPAELLETFETILELNGAALVVQGDLITVTALSGAPRRVGRVGQGGVGTRVVAIPLAFVGTAEMLRLLEPIAGASVEIQPVPSRNVLLVSGSRAELNALIEAVNLFDVDVLKGKSVGLFTLRAAEPEAVVEELRVILEAGEGGSLQNVLTLIPSQRLGAVLVVSSRAKYLAEAERWIRELDRAAGGVKRRPVVYRLENRSAEELAPILAGMTGDVAEEGGPAEGTPTVVADDARNAVIVWGNDDEQQSFARLIHSLDTTPVQVLLEATIAEVSLNDQLEFGLRFFFERGGARTTFTDASNGAVSSTFPGLSALFSVDSAAVALNALASVTDVEVVSSPSLLVLDNREATLQIGDEVPIATQQVVDTADPDAPIVNTISFRDTGIILSIRPRVSRSGQVILDIEQEVSSVANTTTSGIDSPTISQRRVETGVMVGDGETIALGGLIEARRNRTNSGVPGLKDAPVVGALFRDRSDGAGKTELLILITPRVIRNGHEARAVTEELRHRIRGADGLVRGGVAVPATRHRILD